MLVLSRYRAKNKPIASESLVIYLNKHLQCRADCRWHIGALERLVMQPSTGSGGCSAATHTDRVPGAGESAASKHGKGVALQALMLRTLPSHAPRRLPSCSLHSIDGRDIHISLLWTTGA